MEPRRRCVGCGRITPKSALVRIALADVSGGARRAVLDAEGTMGGRGAYLCREQLSGGPEPACLDRAARRGQISRALRSAVTIDSELIESVGR